MCRTSIALNMRTSVTSLYSKPLRGLVRETSVTTRVDSIVAYCWTPKICFGIAILIFIYNYMDFYILIYLLV